MTRKWSTPAGNVMNRCARRNVGTPGSGAPIGKPARSRKRAIVRGSRMSRALYQSHTRPAYRVTIRNARAKSSESPGRRPAIVHRVLRVVGAQPLIRPHWVSVETSVLLCTTTITRLAQRSTA